MVYPSALIPENGTGSVEWTTDIAAVVVSGNTYIIGSDAGGVSAQSPHPSIDYLTLAEKRGGHHNGNGYGKTLVIAQNLRSPFQSSRCVISFLIYYLLVMLDFELQVTEGRSR